MKLLFGLACLMTIYVTSAVVVTDFTPSFLMGTWYTDTAVSPTNDCCVPYGTITFDSDGGETIMTASAYAGTFCQHLNRYNYSSVTLPFDSSSSYYELPHAFNTSDTTDGEAADTFYYQFTNLYFGNNFTNGSAEVGVTLQVFDITHARCAMLSLVKNEDILKAGFVSLTALVSLLAFLVF